MKRIIKIVFDWLFRDTNGHIVIVQAPNWPLYLVLAFYFLNLFELDGLISLGVWGGRFSLLYWAYLEMFQGVNGFRKFLGTIVAIGVVLGILGF